MYTLSDQSQFQAGAIQQGRHKLATIHQEIMDWMTKQFGVRALDFCCETRVNSEGTPQQVVHVILETAEQVKQMQANHDDTAIIVEQFLKYFKSADPQSLRQDPLKGDVIAIGTNPSPEISVTYRPLKELEKKILEEMLMDEKHAILKTFESVWKISNTVVFYYTDAQVKENGMNRTSTKINAELEQVDKKYKFNPGYPYRFDSKETFDRDYESNWYYYWK